MENKKVTNLAKKSQSRGSGHGMTRSALIKMRSFESPIQVLESILQIIKEQTGKYIYNDYEYTSMWTLYDVTTIPNFLRAIETKYGILTSYTRSNFYLPDGRVKIGVRGPTVKKLVDFVFNNQRQSTSQSIQTRV